MAQVNKILRSFVDGELWDASDVYDVVNVVNNVVESNNAIDNEITIARDGEPSLHDRINRDVGIVFQLNNGTLNTNLNADTVDGYHAGNSSGQIPINNGTLNTNLNADMVDGYHASIPNQPNTVAVRDANGNINANITGSVDTATRLTNPVNINFQGDITANFSFDGSVSNINVSHVVNNSLRLSNYTAGNSQDQIPISNGIVNVKLNADMVDGFHANQTPTANTIPVSDSSGKLDANWIPNTNLNADVVDGFHASLTPSANTIVPLNSSGISDLSTTYIKSDTYTFRRVDLTGASSDYMLQIGEEAIVNFHNTTTVPLHIATQVGTYYECHLVCSNTGGTSGGTAAEIFLNPNNTTYSSSFKYAELGREASRSWSGYPTYSSFRCGGVFVSSVFYITNFVQYKNVKGIYDSYGTSVGYPSLTTFSTDWQDTTTYWTSLGTIIFPQSTLGYVLVRRLV